MLHPGPVQLNVGSVRGERDQADIDSPLEILTKIRAVGLQRPAAVSSQERHDGQLHLVEQREFGR